MKASWLKRGVNVIIHDRTKIVKCTVVVRLGYNLTFSEPVTEIVNYEM